MGCSVEAAAVMMGRLKVEDGKVWGSGARGAVGDMFRSKMTMKTRRRLSGTRRRDRRGDMQSVGGGSGRV